MQQSIYARMNSYKLPNIYKRRGSCKLCVYAKKYMYKSLNEYFDQLNWCVLICITMFIAAETYFNVVSRGLRQLFAEPRRIVVGAARGVISTSLAIPERVVWIKHISTISDSSCLAEVIFSDKGRGSVCSATGTAIVISEFRSK